EHGSYCAELTSGASTPSTTAPPTAAATTDPTLGSDRPRRPTPSPTAAPPPTLTPPPPAPAPPPAPTPPPPGRPRTPPPPPRHPGRDVGGVRARRAAGSHSHGADRLAAQFDQQPLHLGQLVGGQRAVLDRCGVLLDLGHGPAARDRDRQVAAGPDPRQGALS